MRNINNVEKHIIEWFYFLQLHNIGLLSQITEVVLVRFSVQKIPTTFHCAEINILTSSVTKHTHRCMVVSDPF